ncbi:MAG: 2-C-methyl-D-erythritol 4-phosphate cytidylyltransferase [Acidobacteria bacterium]|nr:2-C-methyl-D-erythritol 4-phosphate cytidylyltransferase [Acidobacteriota bacterium]
MKISVILPAAGLGTRMSRPSPAHHGVSRKQFMLLDGETILIHTIRKFSAVPRVCEIVVALRKEDVDWVKDSLTAAGIATPVRLVEGGGSRQQSVQNALATIGQEVDLVAVHDAVRPFVDTGLIDRVIDAAEASGAAIAGIVPVDTVKQVHRSRVRATIPRDRLVLAQTPQIFRLNLLRRAYQKAQDDEFTGTDESSLVERMEEVEVTVVAGSDRNIKITRPTDMELARLFLAEEQAAGNQA